MKTESTTHPDTGGNMRSSGYKVFVCLYAIIVASGCADSTVEQENHEELVVWEQWLEEGIDSGNSQTGPYYVPSDTVIYDDDIEINPTYSSIGTFAISDSVIIVADYVEEKLHAYSLDGEFLWSSGQPGEGPGCLSAIGGIDAAEGIFAVCNMNLGRVDLFNIDTGSYQGTVSIAWPFDVSISDDSLICAVSAVEGSIVTVFDYQGNIINRFGEWNPPETDGMVGWPEYGNVNLKCDICGDMLLLSSVFYNYFQVYNYRTGALVSSFTRTPSLPGNRSTSREWELRINDCVFDEAGDIVVLLCPTKQNWLNNRYAELSADEIPYKGFDIYDVSGVRKEGFAVETDWFSSTAQFSGNDLYLANAEMLVKYSPVEINR